MKETSGLEVDSVLGNEPYLRKVAARRKTTITKSEEVEKKKKPARRTVADLEDLYERYYLQEKPGKRQHKEEEQPPTPEEEAAAFDDIEASLRQYAARFKLTPQQLEYALQLTMEELSEQLYNYGVPQGEQKFAKIADKVLSGEIPMEQAQAPAQQSTQQIRRSRGEFDKDFELANVVTKAMNDEVENRFTSDDQLANHITDIMKSEHSPVLQWTQSVDPEIGAVEEYHTPFNNNVVKATIRFYEKTQKNRDHYSVQFEHDGIILAKDFPTLSESRNYLKGQREYDVRKYFGIRETEKPRSTLHVLHDAYKRAYEAATDEFRKMALEEKLKKIRFRLGIDKPKEEPEEEKKVDKTFVDDVAPTSWSELNTIVKMSTYKTDYTRLIEHGIYDKDHNLVDLEEMNEHGEYYTREGEKIPSDDIKAVREILQTGVYSKTGLKDRKALIV